MAISEARRFKLHGKLRDVLGDDMGTTLMEHLPPSGWSNVARQDDVERRFDSVENELRSIRSSVRFLIGLVVATAVSLLVMFIQLNEAITAIPR